MLSLAVLAFAGCEKEIEFDGDTTEQEVVLVSQPEADSVWMVRLTWSRFFLSEKPIATIDDATVMLTVNGTPFGTATAEGNGMYNTHMKPSAGDSLQLQVTVSGRPIADAACRIPQPPRVSRTEVTTDTVIKTYQGYYTDIDSSYTIYDTNYITTILLTLDDPAGEHNYYCLELQYRNGDEAIWRNYNISVEDNVIFSEQVEDDIFDIGGSENESYGSHVYFSDANINGASHTIRLDHPPYMLNDYSDRRLVVRSLSKELFLYLRSLKSQQNSDGIGFLSEPVQIICNVHNGIGVLGGSAAHVINL